MKSAFFVFLAALLGATSTHSEPGYFQRITASVEKSASASDNTKNPGYSAGSASELGAQVSAATAAAKSSYHCDTGQRPMSTPVERFDINDDGTLTDFVSGLTWMRCALGQAWNGSTCVGEAESFSWDDAQRRARGMNSAGGYAARRDWRVPKLPELAGIVERQCDNPRINLQLFPNTPEAIFWSSSSKANDSAYAYALSFGAEGVLILTKEVAGSVRLVRGGD